jgi:hypothetical protein
VGLDDMLNTESAFVAAATAAVLSPKARHTLRRGAVYGVAGALKAGDVVAGAARGVVHGVRGGGSVVSDAVDNGAGAASAKAGTSARTARTASSGRSGRSARSNKPSASGTSARRAAASTKSAGSAAGS